MRLDEKHIKQRLTELSNPWQVREGALVFTFAFKDFLEAIAFVDKIAELAEQADHHPDIDIRHNKVTIALSTHGEGGLTEKDFALAGEIDTTEPCYTSEV